VSKRDPENLKVIKLTAVLGSEIISSISSSLLSLGLEVESSSWRELVIMAEGGGDGDGALSFCRQDSIVIVMLTIDSIKLI
jgi:hypothetical protein